MRESVIESMLKRYRKHDRLLSQARPTPESLPSAEWSAGCEWPIDIPDEHHLISGGVTSHVFESDRTLIGHVGFCDWDSIGPEQPLRAFYQLADEGEPCVLVRSSANSYHLWLLRPRPFGDALATVEQLPGVDEEYLDWVRKTERMGVRTAPKRSLVGEIYRVSPVVLLTHLGEGPVSRPHLSALADMPGEKLDLDFIERMLNSDRAIGETTTVRAYETTTDEMHSAIEEACGEFREARFIEEEEEVVG